jgi:formamidopyrimidine-DNA glycosylase
MPHRRGADRRSTGLQRLGNTRRVPELPEVETIRSQLEPALLGAEIVDAWAFASAKFSEAPMAIGGVIGAVRRRGKYLLVDLDQSAVERELIIHLGMTGRLSVHDLPDESPSTHLRARWELADGRVLRFDDIRRFGRIAVVDRGQHAALPTLAALGPEPFDADFTPELLRDRINASSRAVKTQLLSQRVVAGVGNIYADEALWRARVHPRALRLTRSQAAGLCESIRAVLCEAVANGGTTLRNYRDVGGGPGGHQRHLDCYGHSGDPCTRCAEPLSRCIIDGRSTTFCTHCQRR